MRRQITKYSLQKKSEGRIKSSLFSPVPLLPRKKMTDLFVCFLLLIGETKQQSVTRKNFLFDWSIPAKETMTKRQKSVSIERRMVSYQLF